MTVRRSFMDKILPKATWMHRLQYSMGRLLGYVISGDSMSPTLNEGDAVLIKPNAKPRVGDIILARHPYKTSVKIVKRVSEILPDGALILIGDNPVESTDSRSFGSISRDHIIGRVVCRI